MKWLIVSMLVCAASAEKLIGKLSTLAHGVSGDVYAKNSNTIVLKNFKYDGTGPDAFFWVGKTGTPKNTDESMTMILTKEKNYAYRDQSAPILSAHNGETVELSLPEGYKIEDLKWFSVWCRQFSVDFGNVMIPANFEIEDDIHHPLAPSTEPEPEPEKDHDDHDHGAASEPEPEPASEPTPEQEPEPEPKKKDGDGAGAAQATLAAAVASFVLFAVLF